MRRCEEIGFAVKGINEDPAKGCRGKREKMAAAHVRECNRGTEARHSREKTANPCYKWYFG